MRIAIVFAVMATMQCSVYAQENACATYFQQDIRNKFVVTDKKTGKQVSLSSLCSNEASSSSSGLSVEYAGVGVGFDQASAVAKAVCDRKFNESDFSSANTIYQSVVDPGIIQAAQECYRLYSKGLHYDIHTEAETNTLVISLTYNGPNPTNITDIHVSGNAKCEGDVVKTLAEDVKKPVLLDTRTRAIVCGTKDAVKTSDSKDIAPGSVVVVTEAGPIYAQIPRRFSPSLEKQFASLSASLSSLQTQYNKIDEELGMRVLASALIRGSAIKSISPGASYDPGSGKLTFPNGEQLKIQAFTSYHSLNNRYATESCFLKEVQSTYVVFGQGAQDTSDRGHLPADCSFLIVGSK